jgi:hypothetical protein
MSGTYVALKLAIHLFGTIFKISETETRMKYLSDRYQIFLGTIYQHGEKYTKLPQNTKCP